MLATNRLRHVAQWQNCPVKPPDIVAARESAFGTKRTIQPHPRLSAIGIAADIVWFVGPRVGPINHHRRRLMSFCIRRTVMRAFVGVSRFAWTRGLKKIILTP